MQMNLAYPFFRITFKNVNKKYPNSVSLRFLIHYCYRKEKGKSAKSRSQRKNKSFGKKNWVFIDS